MKTLIFSLLATLSLMACVSTPKKPLVDTPLTPKLAVGIVVDQMRYDYLTRYWDDFGDGGFKRLMKGFVGHNHHYSYAPTYTGPGHASIYTGTTPALHGIISNGWYDYEKDTSIYCVFDPQVEGVGTQSGGGKMSPHRLLTTTLCDELKLASNGRSKTFGVSMKDRGSILPAGHTADAAYWFVGGTEGQWVSSTFYMDTLPDWVREINATHPADSFLKKGWSRMLDESVYDESLADNNPYEGPFTGEIRPTFPYDLDSLKGANGNYDLIKSTPWGNTLTVDFARALIEKEALGQDEFTDFLAMSFSCTDYIGHRFGPLSQEVQDTYLRLDQDIASFLNFLDEKLGKDQYLVFLTADHGVVRVPSFLINQKVPAGYWNPGNMVEDVKLMLNQKWGPADWIKFYSNDQFFLDRALIEEKQVDAREMEDDIASFVQNYEGVQAVYTRYQLSTPYAPAGLGTFAMRGFNPTRSGDVSVFTQPGWLQYSTRTGSSHGSPYAYDTHVPLLIYGAGIHPRNYYGKTETRDVAPTICSLFRIQMPNGCTGNMIEAVFQD